MNTSGGEHDFVERWIAAWTHSRSLEVSIVDGWPLVRVASVTRETELICFDPGPVAFAELLHHVDGAPRAMLTVIARDVSPYACLDLPAGIRVDRDDETLMSTVLTPMEVTPLDEDLQPRWDFVGNQATYAVESADLIAAEGKIGILGTDATCDAVETMPAFRRRGLGRHVMAALTMYALENGAREGVLAATANGRLLYESLGWHPVCEMRSLMGVSLDGSGVQRA